MYRTVADFTYDWEYWRAPDGQMVYVSPSCERVTGRNFSEFINEPELIESIVLSNDLSIWKDHRQRSKDDEKNKYCQFRIKHRDGSVRWIDHACQRVYLANDP